MGKNEPEEVEGEGVPPAQKGSWKQFLKSIMAASGDLSSMTAPSFILSPTSLVEFSSYWGEPYQLFSAIADAKSPDERQLKVTEWFISTLAGQFTRREKETGSEKKPLNPILGEQFIGSWNNGEVSLISEQVSHHPPITAYLLENKSKRISYEGHCAQKTSISGTTIVVRQVGHGMLRIALPTGQVETYLITLPKLQILGVWFGKPYVELAGTSYIQASHGLCTTIEYRSKGYFSGKSHSFTASIGSSPNAGSHAQYTIDGQWTAQSSYVKPSPPALIGNEFFDGSKQFADIKVGPLEGMDPMESRRVWKDVADGIRKGDFDGAGSAKSQLENAERQKRKDEAASGKPFECVYFQKIPDDPEYHKLAHLAKFKPDQEESYRFKQAAGEKARRG